jgi:hypothetical protein
VDSVRVIIQNVSSMPKWFQWAVSSNPCFIFPSSGNSMTKGLTIRSVKRLTERVANIEQYLRTASDRDRPGGISPKFKEARQLSIDENNIVDNDTKRTSSRM